MPGSLRNHKKGWWGWNRSVRSKVLGQDARGVTSHTMQGLVSHCKELAFIQNNESHCRVLCGEVPRSNLCFNKNAHIAVLRINSGYQGLKQVDLL